MHPDVKIGLHLDHLRPYGARLCDLVGWGIGIGNDNVQILKAGERGWPDATPLGRIDQGDHLAAHRHDDALDLRFAGAHIGHAFGEGQAVGAKETGLYVVLTQDSQAVCAHQRDRFALQGATGHDHADAECVEHRLGYDQAVGQDGQVPMLAQGVGKGHDGAGGIQKDGITVGDKLSCGGSNALLLGDPLLAAQVERELRDALDQHCAAVGAHDQVLGSE